MSTTDPQSPPPWVGSLDDVAAAQGGDGYEEFLRAPSLSMGLFVASPGHDDVQDPHAEDEVYVVTAGRAVLDVAGDRAPVGPGTVAFVPAGVPHRFLDVSEGLRVLVFFAPVRAHPEG